MEKSYAFNDLCVARKRWLSAEKTLQQNRSEIRERKQKNPRRVVWGIILLAVAVLFFLFTYYGEAKGELTLGEILQAAKAQLMDEPIHEGNIFGGIGASVIALVIGLILLLKAIAAKSAINSLLAEISRVQQDVRNIEETYGYDGRSLKLEQMQDTPQDMQRLKQETKDLFAALFIFREDREVYHKNWLSRLGLEFAGNVFKTVAKEDAQENPVVKLMAEGENTNWYVQVANMATVPVMTAVSTYSLAWDKEIDYDGTELFTTAYANDTRLKKDQEDPDFLRVVKEVMTFWPASLAAIMQENIREKLSNLF